MELQLGQGRCNSGRPYPAANLTEKESPCEKFYGCNVGGREAPQSLEPASSAADLSRRQTLPTLWMYNIYGGARHPRWQICRACNQSAFLRTFDWQIFSPLPHPFGWQTIMFFFFVWQLSAPLPDMLKAGESLLGMHTLSTLLLHVFVMIMARERSSGVLDP